MLLLLIFGFTLHAAELEIGVGSLTQHFWFNDEIGPYYSNKLNERGLISNYTQSIAIIQEKDKYTFFWGKNSVDLEMYGFKYSSYLYGNGYIEVAPFWGFYIQDNFAFTEKSGLYFPFALGNFMPLLGVECNLILRQFDGAKLVLNNNVTPFLSTHSLGLIITLR